jgi:hypothetical protein
MRRRAEGHLAECAACRERAAQFRLLWSVLDEAPAPAPSPSFDAAVRGLVAQEPRRVNLWAWLVPSPRMAMAVAALLVLSTWLATVPITRQTAPPAAAAVSEGSEAEFSMIQDLPVLEDYDTLSSFDVLSELPLELPAGPAEGSAAR